MNSAFWSSGYAAIIVGCGGYFCQLAILVISRWWFTLLGGK